MEHNGVQIYCVKEVLEDSLIGRITRMFLGFLAEWEWEKIRERTTTGRINKAKEGKIVGGRKLPYGWKFVLNEKGEKVSVVHDNHQLWVARWLAIKYSRGTSTLELAKVLTERGIPTPENGKEWHPIMIRRILSNERLTGKAYNFAYQNGHKAKEHLEPIELPDDTYPPIISQALFDKLQVRLARNKDESTRRSERPEEFLLRAGYIRCGHCTRKMNTRIDRSKRTRYVNHREGFSDRLLYRCKQKDPLGNIVCCGQELPSKEIDSWVEQQLLVIADHTQLIAQAIELATNVKAFEADAKAIDASLKIWEQKAQNYLEDLEDPTLRGDSRASIRHSLNLANQHIEQLKIERSQVLLGMIDSEREKTAYNDILGWCQKVKEAREELTYQQKRDFLHMMGIVAVAKRGLDGQLDLSLEIELPQIKELISSSVVFEDRFSW
jgi:site-specific DNA recombinase